MSLKLNSSGGGSVTLQEPTTASNVTLNLPAADGTVVSTASTAVVTPAMLTQPLTSATAVASTSGTAIDFTSIPSWVKRITVMFSSVSTNGTSNPLIQIGSGGVTTSGYSAYGAYVGSSSAATSYSTGFGLYAGAASNVLHGHAVLTLVTGNTWVCSINIGYTSSFLAIGSGNIALSGTLDRLRITTVNGTDAFDAGSINIMYEG